MTTPASPVDFHPFAEGSSSHDVAGMTVENGSDRIAFYGQADLTRDAAGLAKARALLAFAQAVVAALEGQGASPVRAEAPHPPGKVRNPFS